MYNHIYAEVQGKKVKFADDGTIWQTGSDVKGIAEAMEEDLANIKEWTKRWRMKLNAEKTEFCLFSRKTDEDLSNVVIKMDGKFIERTESPKLLGITLDEKLNFQKHIDAVEKESYQGCCIIDSGMPLRTDKCSKYAEIIPKYSTSSYGIWIHSMANRKLWATR